MTAGSSVIPTTTWTETAAAQPVSAVLEVRAVSLLRGLLPGGMGSLGGVGKAAEAENLKGGVDQDLVPVL